MLTENLSGAVRLQSKGRKGTVDNQRALAREFAGNLWLPRNEEEGAAGWPTPLTPQRPT